MYFLRRISALVAIATVALAQTAPLANAQDARSISSSDTVQIEIPDVQSADGTESAFGDRETTSTIDGQGMYRLPMIYVTEATLGDISNNQISGSFTMQNADETIMGGLTYKIEIYSADESILFSRTINDGEIALARGEEKNISFTADTSALSNGSYLLRVQVMTAHGKKLGWRDMKFDIASSTAPKMISLYAGPIELPEFDGQQVPPTTGPNVDAESTFIIHAFLKNTSAESVTFIPSLDFYAFDMSRGNPQNQTFAPVTVAAGAEKAFAISAKAPAKAEVYAAILQLKDSTTKTVVSSIAEYRVVVRGSDADVIAAKPMSLGMKKGSISDIRIDAVGAPDAETAVNATVEVTMSDDEGVVGQISIAGLELSAGVTSGIAHIQSDRDIVGTPKVSIVIKNEQDVTIETYEVVYGVTSDAFAAIASPVVESDSFASKALLGALVVLLIAGAAFAIRKMKISGLNIAKTAPAAGAALAIFLCASSAFANGINVVDSPTIAQYLGRFDVLGTRPAVQILVNMPAHDAPANTYAKNSVPYGYTVTYAVCDNVVTRLRIIARYDRNGGKHSNLTGTAQSDWVNFVNTTSSHILYEPVSYAMVPGHYISYGRPVTANGTIDLSSVAANNTTLQFVAKMYASGFTGPGGYPDAQVVAGQAGVAMSVVNVWVNWAGGSSSSSSSSSTPAQPDLTIQKTGPANAQRGDTIAYNLTVTNLGAGEAQQVTVNDIIPAGTTYISANGADCAKATDVNVICTLGTIAGNQSKTFSLMFRIDNTVACESIIRNGAGVATMSNESNYSNNLSTTVETRVNCPNVPDGCIEIRKTALNPSGNSLSVVPQFTFSLDAARTVQNDSTGYARFDSVPAGTHSVTEILPQGWTMVSMNPNGIVTVNGGNNCAQVTVVNRQNSVGSSSSSSSYSSSSSSSSRVPPECSDGVDNADSEDSLADALDPGCHTDGNPNNPGTYDPNDPSELDNIDFDIEVDDDEDEVEPEDDITYVVEVTNNTNSTVTNVTVTTDLDNDVNFEDCSDDCDDDDERITWTGLTFGPRETKYFTIDAEVDEDAEDGDELNTDARVFNAHDDDETDVVDENNDDDDDDNDDDADIKLHKDASTSEVFPGGMVQYTVRIRNTGDVDLEYFTVTDTLPMGVQVIDDGNADRNSGGRLVWEIDQLDQGDSWSVSYRVSVPQWTAPGTILRNDVRVLDQETGVNVGTMAIVSVIGALPQTGGDIGGLFTLVISMIGAGAGVGMKFGKKFI